MADVLCPIDTANGRAYIAGHFIGGNLLDTSDTFPAQNIYAVPWPEQHGGTLSALKFFLRTSPLGSAGAKARIGLYKASNAQLVGDLYPVDLVVDAGEVAIDSGGNSVKTFTVNVTLHANTLYWAVILIGGSSNVGLRTPSNNDFYSIMGLNGTDFLTVGLGIKAALTYGNLPDPFPAGGTVIEGVKSSTNRPPAIGLVFSA